MGFSSWGPLLGKYKNIEPKKVHTQKGKERLKAQRVGVTGQGHVWSQRRARIRTRVLYVCARVVKSGGGMGLRQGAP